MTADANRNSKDRMGIKCHLRNKRIVSIGCMLPMALMLALATLGAGCHQAADDTVQMRLQAMLDTKYSAYNDAAGLPEDAGILLYLTSPQGNWLATAGLPSGADENWHYRIASVSKTFTAASIMLLDQQGRLDIDDILTAAIPGTSTPYLPDTPNYAIPYKATITIRELLAHRAGIFDLFNNKIPDDAPSAYAGYYYGMYVAEQLNDPYHTFTIDELAGVLAANDLSTAPPDTEYRYSDTGYNLLAKIIERVSGERYGRFLADHFFIPMGLTQTSAPWQGEDITLPSPYFAGYSSDGSGWFETVEDNMSAQIGPGNIISTPSDTAHWMRTLLSGKGPLSPTQIARMGTVPSGNTTYALGLDNTELGLGHSGAHPGYVNYAIYNPDDDVAVVVVTLFIDYTRLKEHANLLLDVCKAARNIAGYPGAWQQGGD